MNKPKILYLSCHSILEYDELKLFNKLGYEWFSLGSYANPANPDDKKRPPIEGEYNTRQITLRTRYSKDNLHPEQIEPFDIIICMHIPDWLEANWDKMKHKNVIWRSIGQSSPQIEERLAPFRKEGLKIIRYSPKERNILGYVGEDVLIRFCKDPDELKDWNGEKARVITTGQSIKKRGQACNYPAFNAATVGLNRKVYGPDNADVPEWGGLVSYEDLKAAYRDNRAFFFTGTQPASYTLGFMEAFMTGIPVVSIGPQLGNSLLQLDTFEVHEIIENGKNGFWSDNIQELRSYVEKLLQDHELAEEIGAAGRRRALELFSMEEIGKQWKAFLEGLETPTKGSDKSG